MQFCSQVTIKLKLPDFVWMPETVLSLTVHGVVLSVVELARCIVKISEDRYEIYRTDGVKMFRFGGGTQLKSEREYNIPAVIVGKHVRIKTDVVNSDIPCCFCLEQQ